MVSDGPSRIASWAKNDRASAVMWLRRSPSVMLNALPVPERNASMLGKLNWPVPSAKLLFRKRRNSPPAFAVWRPAA